MFGNFSREYYWALELNRKSGRYCNLIFTNGKIAENNMMKGTKSLVCGFRRNKRKFQFRKIVKCIVL